MDSLTRLMRDATDLAPQAMDPSSQVNVDEVWRRGRRRRTLRTAASLAGALVAVTLVASVVLGSSRFLPDQLLPADRGGEKSGVTAYPQRIGHQWWVTDLSDTSSPMAALVKVGENPDEAHWQTVDQHGGRHAIGAAVSPYDVTPAISPNGNRIAYLEMPQNRWVVLDLDTGAQWSYSVGASAEVDGRPVDPRPKDHRISMQSPAFFSPSGTRMVVPTDSGPVVIDIAAGSLVEVDGMDQPAGWLDDDRLVGRTIPADVDSPGADPSVDVVMWDRQAGGTSALGRVDLRAFPVEASPNAQWWGSVRADQTLWIVLDEMDSEVSWLGGVSLPDLAPVTLAGSPTRRLQWTQVEETRASAIWQGDAPVALVPGQNGLHVYPSSVKGNHQPITVIEPSVEVHSIVWAEDALNGGPSFNVFGTSTAWWSWWWKEIALLAVPAGLLVWWRRRRRPSVAE